MRGKVYLFLVNRILAGITPAYAGKRILFVAQEQKQQDHPRVCGEKPRRNMINTVALGSPPRMRGKVGLYSPLPL